MRWLGLKMLHQVHLMGALLVRLCDESVLMFNCEEAPIGQRVEVVRIK
jgi:hypothetical protein